MVIYLIHGFNVKDGGERTLGWLKPTLEKEGHTVKMVDYGWVFRLRVRLCNSRLAKVISSMAEERSVAIGHSNGCDLIYRACMEGAPFSQVILFNPALDSDKQFPEQVEKVHIFYSPSDDTTGFSKWIPFSNWGNMGQVGYTGLYDERVGQSNQEKMINKKMGHSDFSKYPLVFGRKVKKLLCSD